MEQTTHLKLRDLNAPENFFKHADSKYADNDHTTTLDFYPIYTECLLVEACEKYYEFTGHRIEAFDHFKMWFASRGPEFFDEVSPPLKDVAAKVKELRAKDDRQGFLELLRQTSFTDLLGG